MVVPGWLPTLTALLSTGGSNTVIPWTHVRARLAFMDLTADERRRWEALCDGVEAVYPVLTHDSQSIEFQVGELRSAQLTASLSLLRYRWTDSPCVVLDLVLDSLAHADLPHALRVAGTLGIGAVLDPDLERDVLYRQVWSITCASVDEVLPAGSVMALAAVLYMENRRVNSEVDSEAGDGQNRP